MGSDSTIARVAAHAALLPTMLLLNFGIFQYLVLLFHLRAREPFVLLMLLSAAVGFLVLMAFAVVDEPTREDMVRVSNFCLTLLLLVQTAHLDAGVASGCDHESGNRTKRVIVRAVLAFANLLILYDTAVVALNVAHLLAPDKISNQLHGLGDVDAVAENLTLAFTFVLRFGLVIRHKGWRSLLQDDTLELVCHVALVAQEYPFLLLTASSPSATSSESSVAIWRYAQGMTLRVILLPCVWMTIGDHHYHYRYARASPRHLSRMPEKALHELIRSASLAIMSKNEGGDPAASKAKSSAMIVPFADPATEVADQPDPHENSAEVQPMAASEPNEHKDDKSHARKTNNW